MVKTRTGRLHKLLDDWKSQVCLYALEEQTFFKQQIVYIYEIDKLLWWPSYKTYLIVFTSATIILAWTETAELHFQNHLSSWPPPFNWMQAFLRISCFDITSVFENSEWDKTISRLWIYCNKSSVVHFGHANFETTKNSCNGLS